jgi:hypothetical protein
LALVERYARKSIRTHALFRSGDYSRIPGGDHCLGARFRSGQKNLRDYFLGGRTATWWAISLSIVSAETSTLTIVGTSLAFGGNLGFLQIVLGYLIAHRHFRTLSPSILPRRNVHRL